MITAGKEYHGRFGAFRHNDLIGGAVWLARELEKRPGLHPRPPSDARALDTRPPHRTQILYMADIAFITSKLNIRPGSRVLEAGQFSPVSFALPIERSHMQAPAPAHSPTRSSGQSALRGTCFRSSSSRTRPRRRVSIRTQAHTPFSSPFACRLEFKSHGFADNVTLSHRNVCKDGFGTLESIDCVFLDLPAPLAGDTACCSQSQGRFATASVRASAHWLGQKHSFSRICCYSPCMEQVMKTVTVLSEHGFTSNTTLTPRYPRSNRFFFLAEIDMYESLLRPHEVNVAPKPLPISEVTKRLKEAEQRKEERRRRQIQAAQYRNASKRKREDPDDLNGAANGHTDSVEGSPKRPKISEPSEEPLMVSEPISTEPEAPIAITKGNPRKWADQHCISCHSGGTRHTSYLTFAVYLPYPPQSVTP